MGFFSFLFGPKIFRQGLAARVIFFYPGEEGTYIDQANVVLYDNGIVHLKTKNEETTTHLKNCEVIWQLHAEDERSQNKVRLLKSPNKIEID